MIITNCKTNGYINPVGYNLNSVTLSWSVEDTTSVKQRAIRVKIALDKKLKQIVFDSGRIKDADGRGYTVEDLKLLPRTKYFWQVEVFGDNDKAKSQINTFETSKLDEKWEAKWLTAETKTHPLFTKKLALKGKPTSARLYVTALGLYEVNINGKKQGEDRFAPHFTDYHEWIQYQTLDVTESLKKGKNQLEVLVGNGWWKGEFSFDIKPYLYGKEFALLAELVVTYKDGTSEKFITDTDWEVYTTNYVDSSIYQGVVIDARKRKTKAEVKLLDWGYEKLQDSRSLPVVVKDTIVPEVITASNGELLLDFKQNMVGILRCTIDEPKGTKVQVNFGEVLQQGNFFNDNYRNVKAEIDFISNGEKVTFEPKFTSFGFRYARVRGVSKLDPQNFIGLVLYSDFEERGFIETSDEKVNRLVKNAFWGIRGNSVDLPTDCPQRNERMGWTGDCQAISGTSNLLFDMKAFYKKWLYELGIEQYEDGCVPDVIPKIDYGGKGACAWGDAATIVPFKTYLATGDLTVLADQYDSMKAWVDFCKGRDKDGKNLRFAEDYRQYGDWLALDNPKGAIDPDWPDGYTDYDFLCSVYFAYSAEILAKTAKYLGKKDDEVKYGEMSKAVKNAIYNYFLKNRTPQTSTQTAYVLALALDLVPKQKREEFTKLLADKFKEDDYVLRTGFVGTIFVLQTLCDNGMRDLAFNIFLSQKYPGWLYAINLGATTIWERWNSLMPDGSVNKGGMNSFNHYAFGMVVEWMFGYIAGIRPQETAVGFKKYTLKPLTDKRLETVKAEFMTAGGKLKSSYKYEGDKLVYNFTVPFDFTADVTISDGKMTKEDIAKYSAVEKNGAMVFKLKTGTYEIVCDL